MLRSMTGYGRSEQADEQRKLVAEVRSVNHRFLDISLRIPRVFYPLESDIRKLISACISRGKVDVSLQFTSQVNGDIEMQVDTAKAKQLCAQLREIQKEAGISGDLDMACMLAFRDLFVKEPDSQPDQQALWAFIKPVLEQALAALRGMQDSEGRAITADLEARIAAVAEIIEAVTARFPDALAARQESLKDRIRQLCEGVALDEQRMVQEIALLADRSDITEELVRARIHIEQFRSWLSAPDAVGRKLDFLLQELNREVNTIGSKASDAEIAKRVVAAKNELEKIREQVQNVM